MSDSFSKFEKPATLLDQIERLPTEVSNGLLNGIDFVLCEQSDPEWATIIHEKKHALWLGQLIKQS